MSEFDFDDIKKRVKSCESVWKRELDLLIAEVERLRSQFDLEIVSGNVHLDELQNLTKKRDELKEKENYWRLSYYKKEKQFADSEKARLDVEKRVDRLLEQARQVSIIDKNINSLRLYHPDPDETTYEEHISGNCSCGEKK